MQVMVYFRATVKLPAVIPNQKMDAKIAVEDGKVVMEVWRIIGCAEDCLEECYTKEECSTEFDYDTEGEYTRNTAQKINSALKKNTALK